MFVLFALALGFYIFLCTYSSVRIYLFGFLKASLVYFFRLGLSSKMFDANVFALCGMILKGTILMYFKLATYTWPFE